MLSHASLLQDPLSLLKAPPSPLNLQLLDDEYLDLTTMHPVSPVSSSASPSAESLLNSILSKLLPIPEVKQWLFTKTDSLATSPSSLSSSVAYHCQWPTGVPSEDEKWSTDPGDLIVYERMVNNIALGTIFGGKEKLMYAVGSNRVAPLGSSLEVNVRRVSIGVSGDWIVILEFCWMTDDSLIIMAKVIRADGFRYTCDPSKGSVADTNAKDGLKIKGELWHFRNGPSEDLPNSLPAPDAVFTFEDKPLTRCIVCNGKGCILCFSTGSSSSPMADSMLFGRNKFHSFPSLETNSLPALNFKPWSGSFQVADNFSWKDIAKRIQSLRFRGQLDIHYFKSGTTLLAQHTLGITGAANSHQSGVLGFVMSFQLPYNCESSNVSDVAQLRQAYLSRVWSADIKLRSNERLWSTPVDPIVSAAAEIGINLSMKPGQNPVEELSLLPGEGMEQEISRLIDEPNSYSLPPPSGAQGIGRLRLPQVLPNSSPNHTSSGSESSDSTSSQEANARYVVRVGNSLYRCTFCHKDFAKRSNTVRHYLTVHEKQRPFKCGICYRGFGHRTHLTRHQTSVHKIVIPGTRPTIRRRRSSPVSNPVSKSPSSVASIAQQKMEYGLPNDKTRCRICKHLFGHPSALNRHFRSTHEGRRIQCLICDKCFTQMSDLERHFRRRHPEHKDPRRFCETVTIADDATPPPQLVSPLKSDPAIFNPDHSSMPEQRNLSMMEVQHPRGEGHISSASPCHLGTLSHFAGQPQVQQLSPRWQSAPSIEQHHHLRTPESQNPNVLQDHRLTAPHQQYFGTSRERGPNTSHELPSGPVKEQEWPRSNMMISQSREDRRFTGKHLDKRSEPLGIVHPIGSVLSQNPRYGPAFAHPSDQLDTAPLRTNPQAILREQQSSINQLLTPLQANALQAASQKSQNPRYGRHGATAPNQSADTIVSTFAGDCDDVLNQNSSYLKDRTNAATAPTSRTGETTPVSRHFNSTNFDRELQQ